MDLLLDVMLRQGEFTLRAGARVTARAIALVGPSGSGKTTLLETIAGLKRPDAGRISIGDEVVFSSADKIDVPAWRRRVGYVPQDVALFPHMSIRRNLLYGRRRGTGASFDRITRVLEIDPLIERSDGRTLSGGERQRIAIARALLSGPRLLLFDEPLTSVDVTLRRRIVHDLQRIRDELQMPLVYVTHEASEARAISDWTLEIEAGRIVRSGPTVDVLAGH